MKFSLSANRSLPLAALLFACISLAGAGTARAETAYYAEDCPAPVPITANVECGIAVLPENRSTGTGEIYIPIVRLGPASGSVPAVMLGGGGPGSALGLDNEEELLYLEDYRRDILGDDGILILMDQRGAGLSQPFLGCSDEEPQECLQWLREDDVQVSAYTTAAAADDVEDIRQLLGIEKWHLIGVSYGARLALEVLRRHPQGVASAVLDSPFPYDAWQTPPFYPATDMLHRIDEQCRQQAYCRLRHGSVMNNIAKALAAETPLTVNLKEDGAMHQWLYDSDDLLWLLLDAEVYNAVGAAAMPRFIRQLAQRNVSQDNIRYFMADDGDSDEAPFADILYYFITCHEGGVLPQATPSNALERHEHADLQDIDEVCEELWGGSGTPPPVVSTDKPVLVISGIYDANTPANWGRTLANRLPNAQFLTAAAGHNPDHLPCVRDTISTFLQSPHTPLQWQQCGSEQISFE